MSQNESKMVTEVEAVRRERKAFAMARCGALYRVSCHHNVVGNPCSECNVTAAALYPLPTIKRPRTVVDPSQPQFEWTVNGGTVMVRNRDAIGHSASIFGRVGHEFGAFDLTAERVTMWADLLANPTEEVPADA